MNSTALPGWFGKLPGMGDFAHRRLPESFRERWDQWLQADLLALRERHEDWVARYLEGPLWFFMLGEQVAGQRAWLGVLMPSVDSVGRYFPFTLAVQLDGTPADSPPMDAFDAQVRRWWALAAQAALDGLENDLDAKAFDASLSRLFDHQGALAANGDALLTLPSPGQSHWRTDTGAPGSLQMTVAGLPHGQQFDALFGFATSSDREAV